MVFFLLILHIILYMGFIQRYRAIYDLLKSMPSPNNDWINDSYKFFEKQPEGNWKRIKKVLYIDGIAKPPNMEDAEFIVINSELNSSKV